ncbi:MAG: bifunctional phosphoglucose/phosphomannose isomerase [Candidatus Omnitrophota bacterium]
MLKIKGDFVVESSLSKEQNLKKAIEKFDLSGMSGRLQDFPGQIRAFQHVQETPKLDLKRGTVKKIIFSGLGGSAICGDLIRDAFMDVLEVPIFVNRDYHLPAWSDKETLNILISYSGNTEETLSAYREVLAKGAPLTVICSGGRLAELAKGDGTPGIKVPAGYPPRTALGYLFCSAVNILMKGGILPPSSLSSELVKSVKLTAEAMDVRIHFGKNPARQLASVLKGSVPVIYSANSLSAVATRWKTQLEENSKTLAFTGLMPEMNHNEVVGWKYPRILLKRLSVIFLRDRTEDPQIKKRFPITADLLQPRRFLVEVEGTSNNFLVRLFTLLIFGDWVSYYLALENQADPTPVDRITQLKKKLAE